MSSILDPNGTASVVFRSDEQAYIPVTAAGSAHTDATIVPILTQTNFIMVDNDSDTKGIKLTDVSVMDSFQFFFTDGSDGYYVYAEDGSVILNSSDTSNQGRKVMLLPTGWTRI